MPIQKDHKCLEVLKCRTMRSINNFQVNIQMLTMQNDLFPQAATKLNRKDRPAASLHKIYLTKSGQVLKTSSQFLGYNAKNKAKILYILYNREIQVIPHLGHHWTPEHNLLHFLTARCVHRVKQTFRVDWILLAVHLCSVSSVPPIKRIESESYTSLSEQTQCKKYEIIVFTYNTMEHLND